MAARGHYLRRLTAAAVGRSVGNKHAMASSRCACVRVRVVYVCGDAGRDAAERSDASPTRPRVQVKVRSVCKCVACGMLC
jgi:hypothetical protein